ncbi:hypothetical protein FYJ24_05070 [Actinomycetaceae bacterium WB03_NA08]|uniref:NlpC/P60 domain-containing protein n=1 Tax=Scrofimicrobium canadense TaxID=2652290 RepID=A0A6N7VQY1_9ACTO|nr:C40 family peptidase [Scrofimicrobium canadense]MSS84147.1 hypothetical protein [Scrofimicrobium canadense]
MQNRRVLRVAAAATLLVGVMSAPMIAVAAPSEDDIAAAREAEQLAEMSVAQLEVQLATVRANADAALVTARVAAEDLNQAKVDLDVATQTEEKAKAEAQTAQEAFEAGRKELATVVQTTYRTGSGNLDSLAPYLSSNGLSDIEARQSVLSSFGQAVDAQLQEVLALQQVADVMAGTAEKARVAKEEAVAAVETRSNEAESASQEASAIQAQTEARYAAVIQELAVRRNTTVELETERQKAIEAEQQKAAEEAARARAAEIAAQQQAAEEQEQREAEEENTLVPETPSTPAPAPEPWYPPEPEPWTPPSTGSGAQGAINYAKQLLGAPYVWGGEGPGYDCSGLVTVAYRSVGIYLTHQSRSQYAETAKVSINSAAPGDLIFWSSNGSQSGIYHVAIYLGNNEIIEAPTFGVPVRVTSIYNWGSVMPYAGRVV